MRVKFEAAARGRFFGLHGRRGRSDGYEGWMYELEVPVEFYVPRCVTILFPEETPELPQVFVDGPESPHRFSDGALCMWLPWDPPSQRWYRRDGLTALVGHIAVHLFKESWWREYGEWLGDEVLHGPIERTASRRGRRA